MIHFESQPGQRIVGAENLSPSRLPIRLPGRSRLIAQRGRFKRSLPFVFGWFPNGRVLDTGRMFIRPYTAHASMV